MPTPLLDVSGLRVQYGGVVAVDDASFEIPQGAIVGLIGPNGAGKTTLIDALTGYHRPTRGRVRFGDTEVTGKRPHVLARAGLTRTFQSVELFDDLTVEENLLVAAERPSMVTALAQILLPGRMPGREAVDWALEVTELHEIAQRYPTELSHGQRKLVGVARALACRPELLLLDEPAAGLDTDETAELGKRLRQVCDHGVTMLLIDHDMGLVLEVCELVYVLDFGKLIAHGTPREIRSTQAVVDAYLGATAGG
ncbi:MAG TPA: ABC transporter ATP-binding protein [Thermoleophilaceae bacterium]